MKEAMVEPSSMVMVLSSRGSRTTLFLCFYVLVMISLSRLACDAREAPPPNWVVPTDGMQITQNTTFVPGKLPSCV